MESVHHFMIILVLVGVLSAYQYKAQSTGGSIISSRSLDALLQDYAFRAFVRPRTGIQYDGQVPSNITGIKIAALRLRSGSLYNRGVSFKEFHIPKGVIVQPYVERLVLVYQNLGNWSSTYYNLPGFTYLTPVLGLLAYDAVNLSANNLPELGVIVSKSPISINFTNVSMAPSARCVYFNLDGIPEFGDLVSSSACLTYRQGHFSIVVNTSGVAPSPAPSEVPSPSPSPVRAKRNASKVWKIVGAVVGGFAALVLLALLVAWMCRYRQKRKVAEMERHADVGEALQMARVGTTQAPLASGTRTQPVLENEYVA
ncbi:uncharacterized protein LOC103705920 [Phoenix dactylifera]|uniref:Uncharacterized protein LOC103705920 n=1 Tax=Phoenix dactylifera TaxID=42345 RepID=A0A8B7BYL7_PHODC|nr:uncharacterized protein LOC103705920 [Phoenix dactylifera]